MKTDQYDDGKKPAGTSAPSGSRAAGRSDATAHPDFQSEQDFLSHAHACLIKMTAELDPPGSDAGANPQASIHLSKFREKQLERLRGPDAICVGRIDLTDGESFHIGPRRIVDGISPVVLSWAAPIVTPFFEATPDEPGELTLRRRLQTERERLLAISDERFGRGLAPEGTLDDALLQEIGRDRTNEMRQIVATIQRDQYAIITRALDSTTVVQGGPGTGKTVVGLHRAALLLYRHREDLETSRVLIVGPNRLFMQYIKYVLPSLGETAADQVAVDNLGGQVSTRASDDDLVARVKGDGRMVEVLRRAVLDRVRPPTDAIRFRHDRLSFSVSAETVAGLIGDFDPSSQSYNVARGQFRASFDRVASAEYARLAAERGKETAVNMREVDEFNRALDRIWPTMSAPDLVRQFLSSEERMQAASSEILTDTERKLIFRKPAERLDQVRWTKSDVPLVDEVQELIEPSARRYGHVVLDEAQDLTPMQLRMVGRRIRGGSVTVLGDLAQATGLWKYGNWGDVMVHLGLEPTTPNQLIHAYRVPSEIMDLALPVLKLTAPSIEPPIAFRRGDRDPEFTKVSPEARAGTAVDCAVVAHKEGGTVAVIAQANVLDGVRAELERRGIGYGDAERDELDIEIELLDPISAKGLEFDHVILLEPGAIVRDASQGHGYRELYVALTRATRSLAVAHSEPLPWPLSGDDMPAPPTERATPQEIGKPPHQRAPGPDSLPARVEITLDEALVLAIRRGIGLEEAASRILLASIAGSSEAEAANALLSRAASEESVAALITSARSIHDEDAGGEST